jgi:hypothetical protein
MAAISALLFWTTPLRSHDPITTKLTWTQEISRLVYRHCIECHGGMAPIPLTTYEQARPWAKAIRDQVANRQMPPWIAIPGIGEFVGDSSLTQPEIDMFIQWVEGGAPEGDPAYLPHLHSRADSAQRTGLRYSHSVILARNLTVKKPSFLVAIRPLSLPSGRGSEAWAVLPDDSVKRLIWLRGAGKTLTRTYVLRTPEMFPARTRIYADGGSFRLLLR